MKINEIPLFGGIREENLTEMLKCLDGREKSYRKGEMILTEEESSAGAGLVLEGMVQVAEEDVFGNRNILEHVKTGQLYGAAFSCAGIKKSPVSVMAVTDCRILLINMNKVIETCPMSCTFHQRLISNLVRIMAIKNVALNEKISHISRRSTKEKLLSYLSDCAKKAQRMHFTIPFDRQELADYLCVERSAMSAELGKLKKTGILDCRKNEFWLKEM